MGIKKIITVITVITVFTMLPALLAGCGKSSDSGQTFRYVLEAEPATLDPAKSTAIPESLVELQLFEGLTRLNTQDQPVPGAAEKWDVSPDGLKYVFYLRNAAKWANGDPVTA